MQPESTRSPSRRCARKRFLGVQLPDTAHDILQTRNEPDQAAGIEIFEFPPTMYPCKVMVVDGLWASVVNKLRQPFVHLHDEAILSIPALRIARRQISRMIDGGLNKSVSQSGIAATP
jgi:hypothetical protein